MISLIDQSTLQDVELGDHPSAIKQVSGRQAPYDTYTSTQAMWALKPDDTTPPPALFTYTGSVPTGIATAPRSSISIPFSQYSNVVWHYDSSGDQWLRYYGSTPDNLADGSQNSAANVVVQTIQTYLGPWVENSEGGLEVQANLVGSGPLAVFRNGVEITGTWQRSSLTSPTRLVSSSGATIPLLPGRTWVELVPNTISWSASG